MQHPTRIRAPECLVVNPSDYDLEGVRLDGWEQLEKQILDIVTTVKGSAAARGSLDERRGDQGENKMAKLFATAVVNRKEEIKRNKAAQI